MQKKQPGLCLIVLIGLLYLGPASAVSISFSPSNSSVLEGDSLDVDIVISDLYATGGSREIVSAFDLDVTYDSSVLNATGVSFGTLLGANTSTDFFDFFADAFIASQLTPGRVDFAESSWLSNADLLSLQTDDNFTLATLTFEAVGVGVSLLEFDMITIPGIDVKGFDPFAPFDLGNPAGAVVNVSAIPLPGAMLLMLTGLLGLGIAGRKGKSSV
jgi:hypothetical protein